ncbi:FAD-binding oxidoreductase [Aestuariivirga sp.]|uniref:FAD-binding oxidoreductase n=1 Tax=Aestuariivirga sp. TaxID=2650926 RepID=UPI00391BA9DC
MAADALAKDFSGKLLRPGEAGYEEARRVHNGLIDKRPALIARCQGTSDVVKAVNLGRDTGLEIAVRGGGHNVGGRATVDNGLMIDLAAMKGIHVDPKNRTIRCQGGVTWGEFNRETQLHALATTGGAISSTGVAGLTLGGGLGWLMPKYGLALDNLISAEVVMADGKVLTANDSDNPDLFWAVRGGGGNFGVVTSFEFNLHPVGPIIYGGLVAHPFERARDVLRFVRDFTAKLPDEIMVVAGLVHAPDGSGAKLAAVVAAHCGELAAGERALSPLKNFASPVLDALGPIPYASINSMLDDGFPKGALNYWKSSFLEDLSDSAIETMISAFARCPSPMSSMLLEVFHGAVTRVPVEATAYAQRAPSTNLGIMSEWLDASQTAANLSWTRETYEALKVFQAPRRYLNYLGDDEANGSVAAAYGPNYQRLRELKSRYDPANLFHMNQNIPPG